MGLTTVFVDLPNEDDDGNLMITLQFESVFFQNDLEISVRDFIYIRLDMKQRYDSYIVYLLIVGFNI